MWAQPLGGQIENDVARLGVAAALHGVEGAGEDAAVEAHVRVHLAEAAVHHFKGLCNASCWRPCATRAASWIGEVVLAAPRAKRQRLPWTTLCGLCGFLPRGRARAVHLEAVHSRAKKTSRGHGPVAQDLDERRDAAGLDDQDLVAAVVVAREVKQQPRGLLFSLRAPVAQELDERRDAAGLGDRDLVGVVAREIPQRVRGPQFGEPAPFEQELDERRDAADLGDQDKVGVVVVREVAQPPRRRLRCVVALAQGADQPLDLRHA